MSNPTYKIDDCPDCGEPLSFHRGVVALTATAYCPYCLWCDVSDGDRQEDAVNDWAVKNTQEGRKRMMEKLGRDTG